MIKSIKKIGLIAGSLALSCSFALGVLFMQGNTALADSTATTTTVTLDTAALFKGDSASTIAPATTFGNVKAVKLFAPYKKEGSAVVPETENGAVAFNGVFTGKTSIEYLSADTTWSGFAFDVYNADGTDLIFNFVRVWANQGGTNYNGGLGYVGYDDDSDASTGDKVDGVKNYASATTTWASPKNSGRPFANAVVPNIRIANMSGEFVINEVGNDDILKIDVTKAKSNTAGDCSLQELVSIQLTSYDADALREGYTIKYRHLSTETDGTQIKSDNVTSVGIVSINGVSLADTTVSATANTTVSYAYEDNGVIEVNKGVELGEFTAKYTNVKVGNMQVANFDEAVTATEKFAEKDYGEYTATVAGKAYTIKVVKPITVASTSVISGAGVTVEHTTHVKSETLTYTGVKVTPGANVAKFNGTFKGTNTIEYLRLITWGGVAFDVCDTQGNRIFTVMNRWRDDTKSSMSAAYNGMYYMYNDDTGKKVQTNYVNDSYNFLPNMLMEEAGKLTITPTADGVSLYASRTDGSVLEWATIPLTTEHKTAITQGYTLQIRRTLEELDGFKTLDGATCLITAINGVSLANETATLDGATEVITVGNSVTDNKVNLVVGDEYVKPTAKVTKARMGAFYLNDYAIELTGNNDVDTNVVGETQITVSAQRESLSYTVNVQTLADALTGVSMQAGAWLRVGKNMDASDRGLGFKMLVSDEAQATLNKYVGGEIYKSVSYGMVIMPYAYAQENAVTAESLFGTNAAYTWAGKETDSAKNAKMILQMETTTLRSDDSIFGAITQINAANVKKQFIGVGYIKFELVDGSFEYLVVESYSNPEANNIRTVYDVAKAVYQDATVTDNALKQWLLENYLTDLQ